MKELSEKLVKHLQELAAKDTFDHFCHTINIFSCPFHYVLFAIDGYVSPFNYQDFPFREQYKYFSCLENELIRTKMIKYYYRVFYRYRDGAKIALNFDE